MALRPDSEDNRDNKLAVRKAAEEEVLLREVDEALRQDELGSFARSYGLPIGFVLILALAAFGGWLFWQERQEGALEERSEQLITTLDELEAGQIEQADKALAGLAEGSSATAVSAKLARAGIALRDNRRAEGVQIYQSIADDAEAPQPYRDLALIRAAAADFEQLEPQEVIDRLKPLAVPGNPWFGSAGELVGMAYLEQGKEDLAGPLFAAIATDDDVPPTLRSRARQMAGLLGRDAIEDVDATLAEMGEDQQAGGASAPPAPQQ